MLLLLGYFLAISVSQPDALYDYPKQPCHSEGEGTAEMGLSSQGWKGQGLLG